MRSFDSIHSIPQARVVRKAGRLVAPPPGLVAAGATVVVFTTGRGTTIGNAISPVIKLASNTPIFERMSNDLDLSAGGVIDGTETIDEVGKRVFDHIVDVANGTQAKAEVHKHREFQFWAEQTVSL